MPEIILFLVLSLAALLLGAELSLGSGEKLGKIFGVPPLVVGLLVIGFGTSLPEFFISHFAAFKGYGAMAMGNLVGSNISNLLLILGASVLMKKISLRGKGFSSQLLIHLGLSVLLAGILAFDKLYTLSCLVLLVFFGSYLFYTYSEMKNSPQAKKRNVLLEGKGVETIKLFGILIVGFALLYWGGTRLVMSAKKLCEFWDVSEYLVSVILLALGTSLPELLTSLMTVLRKRDLDLILGNIIGSNIFNIAFVMGSLIFYPIDLPRNFFPESAVLVVASLLFWFFAMKKWALSRFFGFSCMISYLLMVFYWSAGS